MGRQGGSRAAVMWARRDVRRRWRSLILLGGLVGLTAGFALSALAGARSTDSALTRLRLHTHAADAVVFPTQVGKLQTDWAALAARPEVSTVAVWDLLLGSVNGQPGATLFGSSDGTYLGSVDKPVVVKGRMFDPRNPDEVVVDENAAGQAPPIGGTFTFQPYAQDQTDTTGPPRGPKVTMRVVGIVREVSEFLFVSEGQVLVSPGFVNRYGKHVLIAQDASVVLRNGAADIAALRHDVNTLVAPGAPILDVHSTSRRVTTTLDVERTALQLLAAAIALGGLLLIAEVLGQSVAAIRNDAIPLRALGMTRREFGMAVGLSHLLPVGLAGIVTFGVALAASDRFPVGLGRRIDPNVGYHVDWLVVGPGVVVTVGAVFLSAVVLGRRADARHQRIPLTRPSTVLGAVRRRAPLSIGLGATLAFSSGTGRRRVPVMPTLLAAVVAVTGVVATLDINRGITNALEHPELAGVTWDVGVTPDPSAQTGRNVTASFARSIKTGSGPGTTVAVVDRAVINVGGVGAPTFSIRPMRDTKPNSIEFTLTSGHAPAMGEAAIGPATAHDLHVGVGDTIKVGESGARVRIVGEALFPDDAHAEFDEGVWLAPVDFDLVVPPFNPNGTNPPARLIAVRFRPGSDVQTAGARLAAHLGPLAQDVSPPHLPDELSNLRNIRLLPEVLAIFLGVVAAAALNFVLLSSSRRRGRDFAILRAIGLRRSRTRLMVLSQGFAISLLGLVVGLPLGIAVGRAGWRIITERVPLSDVTPIPLLPILMVIPAAIAVAGLLSVWPGWLVSRSRFPSELLRAE